MIYDLEIEEKRLEKAKQIFASALEAITALGYTSSTRFDWIFMDRVKFEPITLFELDTNKLIDAVNSLMNSYRDTDDWNTIFEEFENETN